MFYSVTHNLNSDRQTHIMRSTETYIGQESEVAVMLCDLQSFQLYICKSHCPRAPLLYCTEAYVRYL